MTRSELPLDADSFLPEHQVRANAFYAAGSQILTERFPELYIEGFDGIDRALDFNTTMQLWAETIGDEFLTDRFGKALTKEDEESANRSEIVFNMWGDLSVSIQRAVVLLIDLAKNPEYSGILKEKSDKISPNRNYQNDLRSSPVRNLLLYAGPTFLFFGNNE